MILLWFIYNSTLLTKFIKPILLNLLDGNYYFYLSHNFKVEISEITSLCFVFYSYKYIYSNILILHYIISFSAQYYLKILIQIILQI